MSFFLAKITFTKNLLIRSVSLLFLISFINIYNQIHILWGNNGILPSENLIERCILKNIKIFPSIIPFLFSTFNISVEDILYIITLIGIILSFLILWFKKFHKSVFMFIIWYIYLNLFLVGQNFMSYEFDYLLMETGFVSIFLCDFLLTENCFLQTISFYIMKFILFKFFFGNGLSIIFSENKYFHNFSGFDIFIINQPIPTMFSYHLNKMNFVFKKLLSSVLMSILLILPFGMFMFFKRISSIVGEIIFFTNLFMILIGHNGLINLICLVLNISNFNDEYFETFFLIEEKKNNIEKKTAEDYLKDKKLRGLDYDEFNGPIFIILIDFCATMVFLIITITLIFPTQYIMSNSLTLSPFNNLNFLNKFGDIRNLHIYMTFLLIYILSFSLYYYVNYDKKKINGINLVKIILFSLLSIIYLMHSMNTFYSGFKTAMTTKQKGNIFYSITNNTYNYLHKFNLVSSYSLKKEFFQDDLKTERKELLIKYSIIKNNLLYEKELNETIINNTLANNDELKKLNESILLNNKTNNVTAKNNTTKIRNKKEWIEINFKKKPIPNELNGNLKYFSSFFNQPRIEIAFHKLAYEKNIGNNIWVINLISKLFQKDKELYNYLEINIPKENIEEIKIDSFETFFDNTNNKTFVNKFKGNFLRKLNKSNIDDFIQKFNKKHSQSMENLFLKIPIVPIIVTLNLIMISITLFRINKM